MQSSWFPSVPSLGAGSPRLARAPDGGEPYPATRQDSQEAVMAWFILIFSGAVEAVWAAALDKSAGFTRLWPSLVFLVACAISMGGLAWAMRSIPVGTAYAVWAGVGTSGRLSIPSRPGTRSPRCGRCFPLHDHRRHRGAESGELETRNPRRGRQRRRRRWGGRRHGGHCRHIRHRVLDAPADLMRRNVEVRQSALIPRGRAWRCRSRCGRQARFWARGRRRLRRRRGRRG